MKKEYPGTIYDIPSGILICRDHEEYCIEELSPQHVCIRTDQEGAWTNHALFFSAFFWEAEGYEEFGPFYAADVLTKQRSFDYQICIEICDKEYARMVERVQLQFQRYVRFKTQETASVYVPAKTENTVRFETFPETYDDWKNHPVRCAGIEKLADWLAAQDDKSLALSLEHPSQYKLFLTDQAENYLPCALRGKIRKLYIGNAFCPILFPDAETLETMLKMAEDRKLEITIVLSYLREDEIPAAETRLQELFELLPQLNFEINDWGWITLLQKYPPDRYACTLGRLLNKHRKDPRLAYKNGLEQLKGEWSKNGLQDPDYLEFLHRNGICSTELETGGYLPEIPLFPCAMHIPWYQTNTSQYCPIMALVGHGDRAHQHKTSNCTEYCGKYITLYPRELSMVGRYNSLFALDQSLLDAPWKLEPLLSNEYLTYFVWNYW